MTAPAHTTLLTIAVNTRLRARALIRVSSDIQVQANVLHGFARTPRAGEPFAAVSPSTALDLAVTYSRRF